MSDTASARSVLQFIDGQFAPAASGATLKVENPANGQVIASAPASAAEDA